MAKSSLQHINTWFFLLILTGLFSSCANIVPPSGGPKDTTPPKVIKTEPPQASTYFASKEIRIYFDEYVQLKDETRNMLVNPPLKKSPEIKIKGKSILLRLPDSLLPNSTYTIQFGNGIQDYNEGNPLTDFSYLFSTGGSIDSLSLTGKVIQAENLKPQGKAIVVLYHAENDSAVYKDKPAYVTRTKEDGSFRFNNLASGQYRMLAVVDENTDLMVGFRSEEYGFIDSLVSPTWSAQPDTNNKEALKKPENTIPSFTLFTFKEKDTIQRLNKPQLIKTGELLISYRQPVPMLNVRTYGKSSTLPADWALPEWSTQKDSLTLWIKPEIAKDSLFLILNTGTGLVDSIAIDLTKVSKGRVKRETGKSGKISATANISAIMDPDKTLELTFGYPLVNARLEECVLIEDKDTLKVKPVFSDILQRHIQLNRKWKENIPYKFILPKGILEDYQAQTNDSLTLNFKTLSTDNYGKLTLVLNPPTSAESFVVQLITEKDMKVVAETMVKGKKIWIQPWLGPGKYAVRIIFDKNNNSRWDSGNYSKMLLPEKVLLPAKAYEVRGNWEVEEQVSW